MDNGRDWSVEIRTLIEQIRQFYLVPTMAEQVCGMLQQRLDGGGYRSVTDEQTLAAAVTGDMQAITRDEHLFLLHSAEAIPERNRPAVDDRHSETERSVLTGHGFAKVERLPGNVGLVDIRRFQEPCLAGAGDAAVAAMTLVAGADVLLVDLRGNHGGEPDMVALICSFLFDERTQLSSLHFPSEEATLQYWTSPFVTGAKFGGTKPIYVLTSSMTFSGGEAMSYDLQQCNRATVVGELTAGAATIHYPYRINAHLMSAVPSGCSINPVSGTNWDGGVKPDIAVPAEYAFDTAYKFALEHVLDLGTRGIRSEIAHQASEMLAEIGSRSARQNAERPPRPRDGGATERLSPYARPATRGC